MSDPGAGGSPGTTIPQTPPTSGETEPTPLTSGHAYVETPAAHIFHSTDMVIPTGVATLLTGLLGGATEIFDTVEFDNDGMYDPAQPDRLTIQTPGLYACVGRGVWQPNSTGGRDLTIKHNFTGGATAGIAFTGAQSPPIGSFIGTGHTPISIFPLEIDDYIQLSCYQTSGINLNLQKLQRVSVELSVTMIGRPPPGWVPKGP